jgi:Zn-dependent peptidase ImmA (M78 family)
LARKRSIEGGVMDRLREILSAPDIDLARVSKRSGLAEERLKALAEGAQASMAEVRSVASALSLSMRDFLSATSTESATQLLFRSAAVGGKPVGDDVRLSLSRRVADPISFLASMSARPTKWQSHFVPGVGSAERNAAKFRELFCGGDQLSPLIRLPQLAEEKLGLMILVVRTNAVDGASGYIDGVPFAIVAARSFAPRMLFTLAHEIGHLVLHHDPDRDGVIIDEDAEWRDLSSSIVEKEREANEFASALLMPAQAVGIALKSARDVLHIAEEELGDLEINFLARLFGVSLWAAALRCERLGLLPRGGAAALVAAVNEEAASAETRGSAVGLPPRPEVLFPRVSSALLRAAVRRVRSGEVSAGRAASALQISIADLMAANVGGHA